jgi:hypothetical protein
VAVAEDAIGLYGLTAFLLSLFCGTLVRMKCPVREWRLCVSD